MKSITKIIVTIIAFFILFVVFGAVVGSTGKQGGGFIGFALVAGFIAALGAIWKKKDKTDSQNEDK